MVGGIGSGKSYAGGCFAIEESLVDSEPMGLIGANTYNQLQNATLASLFATLEDHGIDYEYKMQRKLLRIGNAQWLTYSLDNYDPIRGIEIGRCWLDETRDTKEDAFKVVLGRLRDRRAKRIKCRLTTSPSGHNWLYDYFQGEKKLPSAKVVTARTKDNFILPGDYESTLRKQYDDKFAKQELDGEFINITSGRAYYGFSREGLGPIDKPDKGTILIGMDFNVNPMTAVLGYKSEGFINVFDEVYLPDSDTWSMCQELKRRGYAGQTVIPDSTARNRKTSGKSDFQILREEGFRIESTRNPFVMDRVNNINRLLRLSKLRVSSKCKKLINDLEKVVWKGSDLDKVTDKNLTHLSDALGYLCWWVDPIERPKVPVRQIKR